MAVEDPFLSAILRPRHQALAHDVEPEKLPPLGMPERAFPKNAGTVVEGRDTHTATPFVAAS
jgi:hypothetical protein